MHLETRHQRTAAVFWSSESSKCNGGRISTFCVGELTKFGEKFITIFNGHTNVAQYHVWMMLFDRCNTLGCIGGCGNRGVTFFEDKFNQDTGVDIVVHNQYMKSTQVGIGPR